MAKSMNKSALSKMSLNFNPVLHNTAVLYFFFLLAIVEIIYFLNVNDMRSVFTLIIVGFLASFFSKNMVVILCLALVTTNLLKYGITPHVSEGFEEEKKEKDDEEDEEKKTEGLEDKEKKSEKKEETEGLEDKEKNTQEMKSDFEEFENLQQKILGGMKKMEPLLNQADTLISKFEKYKNKNV